MVMRMYPHKKHWMRHTAMVPKGFIRYHVLESLSKKPMSGSEIISEIEKRTEGRWKPSPGSIYPLLAWLQDSGYVKELPTDQNGLKRYELTESGSALLNEQRKIGMESKKEARMFAPPFLGALWFRIPPEETAEIRESLHRVVAAFFELGSGLERNFSRETVDKARKVLKETAEKLEEINEQMRDKQDERGNNKG
jgi:DNA-binding PadR family transcriptional regulator